jgi:tetratricopeptide (TPR) repeat protein
VTPDSPEDLPERLGQALRLVDDAHRDSLATIRTAEELLSADKGDEAACVALRALGVAWKQRGELSAAHTALTDATRLGDRLGLPLRASQARTSLATILADMGRTDAAFAQAELAKTALTGLGADGELDLARLWVNLGLLLQRTGRADEALALFAAAEPVLVRNCDAHWEILLRNLRGSLLAYRGEYLDAVRDLTRARELAEEHGYKMLCQVVSQSLGFAAAESGDIPLALRELDLSYDLAVELGKPTDWALIGRAEALLTVGRAEEAQVSAAKAAEHLESAFKYNAAEARLIEARAALQAGDAATAAVSAARARDAFTRQHRPGWAAWAQYVALAARFAQGERTPRLLAAQLTNAVALAQAGWLAEPQQATLLAARTAAALDRGELAGRLYANVAEHRKAGPAHLRMLGWEADAELHEFLGQPGPAAQSVAKGLTVAAEYAGTLGATDLRAAAAGLGGGLARIGVRLALAPATAPATATLALAATASGAHKIPQKPVTRTKTPRPGKAAATLLVRAEQWRATTLRRRPVRPPEDDRFTDQLTALRSVNARISAEGPEGKDVSALQTDRVRLEREITSLARQTPGNLLDPAVAHEHPLDLKSLRTALGDRVLIEYLHFEDLLFAITYADGRARRHDLGPYSAVLAELEALRFAMKSLAGGHTSAAVCKAFRDSYDYARGVLDKILLAPLAADVTGRSVVIVPTGSLHVLAWPVLPTLAGRACTVTPSARSWLAGAALDPPPPDPAARRVLLAYGPGLPHARTEIVALSGEYKHAKPLMGPDATASAVARGLDGAYLAHLATHGRFRADNPLFSSIELADGPLTVYELEQLGQCPEILILSACNTALTAISPGDELMGVASAVFALGTRTLIASVAPVPDEAAAELMIVFHKALAAGLEPARALANAELEIPRAPGFICLGTC